MKITVEDIDRVILKRLLEIKTPEDLKKVKENTKLFLSSKEFGIMLKAHMLLVSEKNNDLGLLIFNCLLEGIEIGYLIAENSIEVKQLEEICRITGEDGDL